MNDIKHDGHIFTKAIRLSTYWDGPDNKENIIWCLTCNERVYEELD